MGYTCGPLAKIVGLIKRGVLAYTTLRQSDIWRNGSASVDWKRTSKKLQEDELLLKLQNK